MTAKRLQQRALPDGAGNYTSYEMRSKRLSQCVQLPGNRDARHKEDMRVWRGRTHRSTLHWHDREQAKSLVRYKALENNGYRPKNSNGVRADGLEIGALSPKRFHQYCGGS